MFFFLISLVVIFTICGNFPEMPKFDHQSIDMNELRRSVNQISIVDIDEHMDSLKEFIDKETSTGKIEPQALKPLDKRFPMCGAHIVYDSSFDHLEGRSYIFEGVNSSKYLIVKTHYDDEWDHEDGWYTPSNKGTIITDAYGNKFLAGRNGMKSPQFAFLEAMETSYRRFGSEWKPPVTIILILDGWHYSLVRNEGLTKQQAPSTMLKEENFNFMFAKYLREVIGVQNAVYWGELGFVQTYDAIGYAVTQYVRSLALAGVPEFQGFENFYLETNRMSFIGVKSNGAFAMNYTCTGEQKNIRLARTLIDIEDNVYPSRTCVTDPAKNPVLFEQWLKMIKNIGGIPGIPPGTPIQIIVGAILPIFAQIMPPTACQAKFGSFAGTNNFNNKIPLDISMYPSTFTLKWESEFYYTHPSTEKSEEEYISELIDTAEKYGCSGTHLGSRPGIPLQDYQNSPDFNFINDITKSMGLVDSVAVPWIFSGAPDVHYYEDLTKIILLFTPKWIEFDPYGQVSYATHQHEENECISFASQEFMVNWYYLAIHNLK